MKKPLNDNCLSPEIKEINFVVNGYKKETDRKIITLSTNGENKRQSIKSIDSIIVIDRKKELTRSRFVGQINKCSRTLHELELTLRLLCPSSY